MGIRTSKIVSIDPSGALRDHRTWGGPINVYQGGQSASRRGPTIVDRTPARVQPSIAQRTIERAAIQVSLGRGTPVRIPKVTPIEKLPSVAVPKEQHHVLPTPGRATAVPKQTVIPPPKKVGLPTNIAKTVIGGKTVGIDLGDLLGKGIDIWGSVARAQARGPTVAAPAAITPTYANFGGAVAMPNLQTMIDNPLGLPGVEVISESKLDQGLVYKKVCGQYKWVKQKHRRRRKLLTDSDYNGLLKLQTLKNNANMNIAIAKALGR